jgi:hypothetical protein
MVSVILALVVLSFALDVTDLDVVDKSIGVGRLWSKIRSLTIRVSAYPVGVLTLGIFIKLVLMLPMLVLLLRKVRDPAASGLQAMPDASAASDSRRTSCQSPAPDHPAISDPSAASGSRRTSCQSPAFGPQPMPDPSAASDSRSTSCQSSASGRRSAPPQTPQSDRGAIPSIAPDSPAAPSLSRGRDPTSVSRSPVNNGPHSTIEPSLTTVQPRASVSAIESTPTPVQPRAAIESIPTRVVINLSSSPVKSTLKQEPVPAHETVVIGEAVRLLPGELSRASEASIALVRPPTSHLSLTTIANVGTSPRLPVTDRRPTPERVLVNHTPTAMEIRMGKQLASDFVVPDVPLSGTRVTAGRSGGFVYGR